MAIQIRRRIGSAGAPASLVAGQLAYQRTAAAGAAAGPDDLYVGDGTAVHALVSNSRQVEIAGAQTITGDKTIAVGNLHITGGTNGQTLATDGSGGMSFVSAPPASINLAAGTSLSGNGLVATPLTITVATSAQVTTGTDDVNPVTSARLRQLTGADVATHVTTAQTIVPAINELWNDIEALESPLTFRGTFNAATSQITPNTGSAGPLPGAAATNKGDVYIVTTAGTPAAPAPVVAMSVGDWIVSDGTIWHHLDLHQPATYASNVSVTAISGMTGTNVQAALAELFARPSTVEVDGTTIDGDGSSGDPLTVIGVDDGTY